MKNSEYSKSVGRIFERISKIDEMLCEVRLELTYLANKPIMDAIAAKQKLEASEKLTEG